MLRLTLTNPELHPSHNTVCSTDKIHLYCHFVILWLAEYHQWLWSSPLGQCNIPLATLSNLDPTDKSENHYDDVQTMSNTCWQFNREKTQIFSTYDVRSQILFWRFWAKCRNLLSLVLQKRSLMDCHEQKKGSRFNSQQLTSIAGVNKSIAPW